jgi:hypothetical protein
MSQKCAHIKQLTVILMENHAIEYIHNEMSVIKVFITRLRHDLETRNVRGTCFSTSGSSGLRKRSLLKSTTCSLINITTRLRRSRLPFDQAHTRRCTSCRFCLPGNSKVPASMLRGRGQHLPRRRVCLVLHLYLSRASSTPVGALTPMPTPSKPYPHAHDMS